jgi:hypothetical protein
MSLTCPKCEKSNSCNCKTCNSDGLNKNLIIILKDEELYQCSFCGYKFCEGEATDFEWDRMISGWAKVATPELCLMWIENKRRIREELNMDDYSLECSFMYHFKIHPNKVNNNTLLELKRDLKLNNLLKSKK